MYFKNFVRLAWISPVFLVASLAGCASRPTDAVLNPTTIAPPQHSVELLAATNRSQSKDGIGFDSKWAEKVHYTRYDVSIPDRRDGTTIAYPTTKPDANRQFVVTRRDELSAQQFISAAEHATSFDGTVGVFVHGYNYSYQEALFRMAQMSADAGTGGAPILFSWPSAASVTGYVGDRDAALFSRTELVGLLVSLGRSAKIKHVVIFGHSMGGFLSMEAVRQLKLEGRSDVLRKVQVVLAAPDIGIDVFRSQLLDIGPMETPITLLVSKSDRALAISSVLAGQRERVGSVDVDDPVVEEAARAKRLRIVDISALKSGDGLGHDRYAAFARFAGQLAQSEARRQNSVGNAGAYVFDAAGAVVASPFRLVGQIARH